MTPEQTWAAAEDNSGLVLEFDDVAVAISQRHKLNRWRARNGGYSEFTIRLRGSTLHIVKVEARIRSPKGEAVEAPEDEEWAAGFEKLRIKLDGQSD